MFSNTLKIAVRNLKRHKGYSFINIAGLGIGLACCILILLWVMDELSYDRFHENANCLYRVITEQHSSGQITHSAETQFPLAPGLKNDFPEVINSARIFTKWNNMFIQYGDKYFVEDDVLFVDASFLNMFTFPLKAGNPEIALRDPYSIVLTEETAYKYFGNEEPLGRILNIDYNRRLTDFRVTGVLRNIPHKSHLRFDFLIPFHIFNELFHDDMENLWRTADNYHAYVQLNKNASVTEVNQKISDYKAKHIPGCEDRLTLQSVPRIHLHSLVKFDVSTNGNIKYVYFFLAIALFIVLIACINFMNLATARSGIRAREVSLRKVVGARRSQIIKQFLGESLILSFIALGCAILIVEVVLPTFNVLSGKQLVVGQYKTFTICLFLLGITLFTGIVSGSYPALLLSAFKPAKVLKGVFRISDTGTRRSSFRKTLVLIQFSLSIILIVSTMVVSNQLKFLMSKDLGFDKENLIYIPVRGNLRLRYPSLKRELSMHPNIEGVTAANILPTHGNESPLDDWEGNSGQDQILVNITSVDYDYFETLDMRMEQGRSYSRDYLTDLSETVIVNEEAVRQMGMISPLGKRVWGRKIIGVVGDYHYMSLHDPIEPIVISLTDRNFHNIFVKIKSDVSSTLDDIKIVYERFVSDYPFEFHFLDMDIDHFYQNEKRIRELFTYFTFLAIFIACLGLLGLASFMTEQRTKEIGIRKVLGASMSSILILLCKEFIRWVLMANIIALPVAYYAMNSWLRSFAYRTQIELWILLVSAALALMVSLLTVSYQAIKAALADPVDALKYE